MSEKPTWKDKIDPALDRIISFYIDFVDLAGLSATTGWIRLADEPVKFLEEKGI